MTRCYNDLLLRNGAEERPKLTGVDVGDVTLRSFAGYESSITFVMYRSVDVVTVRENTGIFASIPGPAGEKEIRGRTNSRVILVVEFGIDGSSWQFFD